jgi:NitT/TauT family transport system ATP-binding protein
MNLSMIAGARRVLRQSDDPVPREATNPAVMSTLSECKLELRGVSKAFVGHDGRALEVLRDINFSVDEGEFVSIIGASGSGKTTLLRIIDGLVTAEVGEILLDGQRIGAPGLDRGFVFQDDALLPWRRMIDNVRLGLQIQGVNRKRQDQIAADLIALVGLKGFERAYPHQLSGGMRQRVNIARALATDPKVLLLDEPFGSLDAQNREIMQSELLKIWTQRRKTVLFVTHQIEEAVYLSDRVVVLSSRPGQIKEILTISLPRPRPLAIKRSRDFVVEYVDRLWDLLGSEILASEPQVSVDD